MKSEKVINLQFNALDQCALLAEVCCNLLTPPALIFLDGTLGAGKTTFVSFCAKHLSCKESPTSPTFTLINRYSGNTPVIHMDLYRLNEKSVSLLDLPYYLNQNALIFIEWAENGKNSLPENYLKIAFSYENNAENPEARQVRISASGQPYDDLINPLSLALRERGL